jgi:ribosomal protein S18 acetylase RimI-like enzyme
MHADSEIRITATRLTGADDDGFARVYEQSFPPSERDDTRSLMASIARGERLCFAASESGELIGLAVVLPLTTAPVALLEYLAVDAPCRNRGIGSRLLRHMSKALPGHAARLQGILLEVEPTETEDQGERGDRLRRIAMYERNGARVVDCAPRYRAPDLSTEGHTLRYTLMWLPLQGGPGIARGALLHDAVRAVLTEGYGLDPSNGLVEDVVDELAC